MIDHRISDRAHETHLIKLIPDVDFTGLMAVAREVKDWLDGERGLDAEPEDPIDYEAIGKAAYYADAFVLATTTTRERWQLMGKAAVAAYKEQAERETGQ